MPSKALSKSDLPPIAQETGADRKAAAFFFDVIADNRVRAILFWIVALMFSIQPWVRADLTKDEVSAAKAATGLLVTSEGTGTAFCISELGIFVTCDHVIDNSKEDKLAIVISPAGKEEKRYPARILRRLKDADLAILKIAPDMKIPALKVGDVAGLFETEQLYAFGYPFGKLLAMDEKSYPAISVNLGRITSLRKKNDVLDVIQLDAQLNPGSSGGPVLDPNGSVVGIVSSGVAGSGVNFAIPISLLTKATSTPIIGIAASNADPQRRVVPVEFTVSVDWIAQPVDEPKVSIEVRGEGQPRRVDAQKDRDGKYRARIDPLEKSENSEKSKLRIALEFESGKIVGETADRSISFGGKPKALGEIHILQRTPKGGEFQADGKPAGTLPELEALALDVGGATVTVDARKASRIEIQKPTPATPPIFYKAVVAMPDGKTFSSDEKALTMSAAGPVSPPLLSGKVDLAGVREIGLPGSISDVVSAQDGRSLLLHMKELKKLAVFDVIDLKIRGYIDLDEEKVLFAGGSRSLLVVCPGENVIQRYSLETLVKEKTVNNSFGKITSITMGRSSPGLAMLIATNGSASNTSITGFDAESMTVASTAEDGIARRLNDPNAVVRASADGRTFGLFRRGTSPSGFTIFTFRDNEFSQFYEHATCGVLVPNADGTQIFTSQSGIFTDKYAPVVGSQGNWSEGTTYLPSYHPMYFISVPYNASPDNGRKKIIKSIGIHLTGNSQALIQMPDDSRDPEAASLRSRQTSDPMTMDKRYHFFPHLDLMLTIPSTNDKIVARSVNVRHLLDEKGIDYLYVTSMIPQGKASAHYAFTLEAASKAGGVKFNLQSGPKGLTVSSDGKVAWDPPAQPVQETVIVSLKDASGQEAFHTFRVVITK